MIYKKSLKYVFCLLIGTIVFDCSSSKTLLDQKIVSGTIVFKEYRGLENLNLEKETKIFADFLENFIDTIEISDYSLQLKTKKDSLLFEKYFNKKSIPNTNFISETLKDTSLIRFEIYKDFYFLPKYLKNGFSDDESYQKGKFFSFGKKITRDSLKKCVTNRFKKCNYSNPILYEKEENYMIEVFKNDKKNILGYNCFRVRVTHKKAINLFYDLYVTEKIKLDYNPLMNLKSLNDQDYFILEKNQISKNQKIITRVSDIQFNSKE